MTAIASKGTAIQLSIASTFTTIAQVYELTGPGPEVGRFEWTNLGSGTGRRKLPTGYVDGGTVSWSMFFDPVAATLQALTALITTPAVASWKVIWSDAASTEWPFSAILVGLEPKATLDDGLKCDCEADLDGLVTYPTPA